MTEGLPFKSSNGWTLEEYAYDDDVWTVQATHPDYLPLAGQITEGEPDPPFALNYQNGFVWKPKKTLKQKWSGFHPTSSVGKVLDALKEYEKNMPAIKAHVPSQPLFEQDADYSDVLPWTYSSSGASLDKMKVLTFTVTGGIVHVTAERLSIYGEVTKSFDMEFTPSAELPTYKPFDNQSKAVKGVAYRQKGLDKWQGFSTASNCARLWTAVKAAHEALEPNKVALPTFTEKAAGIDYHGLAPKMGWAWNKLVQLRCFAAYHGMTTYGAASALNVTKPPTDLSDDTPSAQEFNDPLWEDLRVDALNQSHSISKAGAPCLVCFEEAKQGGKVPDKLKMGIGFAEEPLLIGTESETDIAKQIRWEISAFAYFHEKNRWWACEQVKEAGDWGHKLLPYFVPADKSAGKVDYYKLKVQEYPNLWLILEKGGNWTCGCHYCMKMKQFATKYWPKGSYTEKLLIPELKALYPNKQSKKNSLDLLMGEEQVTDWSHMTVYKVETAGPKNVLCLLNPGQFAFQMLTFAATHGLSRKGVYDLLPETWQAQWLTPPEEGETIQYSPLVMDETTGDVANYGEIAVAINCKCQKCQYWVKKTPTKTKQAMTVKKMTKKAVLEHEATMEQAMGEGLEVDPSALEVPIKDQAIAYAAYHDMSPATVWCYVDEKYGDTPFKINNDVPDVGGLKYHVWPEIETTCDCEECQHSKAIHVEAPPTEAPLTIDGYSMKSAKLLDWNSLSDGNTKIKAPVKKAQQAVKLKAGEQIIVSTSEDTTIMLFEDMVWTVIPG